MDDNEHNDKINAVVKRFVAGLPQRVESIKDSISSCSWSEAELLTHRLAGASLFGFPATGQAAKVIENAIKNKDYQIVSTLTSTLEQTIKEELADKNKSVLI
jgi:HPt (histidine-containing phosphotransfer) domain-containing protein